MNRDNLRKVEITWTSKVSENKTETGYFHQWIFPIVKGDILEAMIENEEGKIYLVFYQKIKFIS